MSRKSLGTLTLDLIAKVGGFEAGLDKASRKSQKTAKQIEKYSNQIGAALTAASAAGITAMTALVGSTVNSAREIKNLSALANTTPQQFQKLTYASKRYGVEQEKMADILKDTNDRIGDFIQTGGGPMADFFEKIAPKVGVTANEFARLSGPEALQLYVKSLEQAGVSQNDMTFYMEAIASDATALLPLLRDNGKELNNLGDEAQRTGNVFSELEFQQLEQVRRGMDELTGAATGMKNELVMGALPAIEDLVDFLSNEQTMNSAQALGSAVVISMNKAAQAIDGAIKVAQFLAEELAAMTAGAASDDIVRIEDELETLYSMLDNPTNRVRFFGKDGIVAYYDKDEIWQMIADTENKIVDFRKRMAQNSRNAPVVELVGMPEIPETASGAAGGSGGSEFSDEYGRLKASLDERYAIQVEYQERLKEIRQAYAAGEIEQAEKIELEKLAAQQRVREEFEFDTQREQYDSHLELYQEFQEEQTRLAEKEAKKRAQVEEQAQSAITNMHYSTWQAAAGFLNTFAGESKAAALASIAITKGLAIAQTLAHTQTASMLAYSSQLVPGDPTSVARAAAAASAVQSLGAIKVGLIAATGLAQAYQATSGGGAVGTGGYSSSGTNPPVPTNTDPTYSEDLEDDRRGVQIIFNGDVNGLDADQISRSIKDHLDSTDFVLIEPASRNGRALSNG
ncbi:hypothetical protein [Marinobacter algicola]|uniref:Phage tail tape meausure protein, lambda family n=1 Tax=Marinobacter algicola DG893 TaxID=443152 RepID=A6F0I9_9GAMM|nr:hypothetical protein [Marinobacter algicola]EDM47750.1 phage tail tape meausure protein, lambda family [Marinobacter algicola DG893]